MTRRGRKPKAVQLRLVDGSFRPDRHGDRGKAEQAAIETRAAFGPIVKPKYLKGEASKAWDQFITPATWLDASRAPAAIAFVALWQEFREAPRVFMATRHAALRAYMSDLGLSDERNRALPSKVDDDEFFT